MKRGVSAGPSLLFLVIDSVIPKNPDICKVFMKFPVIKMFLFNQKPLKATEGSFRSILSAPL